CSEDGSNPPWSIPVACQRSKTTWPSTRSRVTPGTSRTSARRLPTSRLKSVDLPTFGRPTIAMTGSSVERASAVDRSRAAEGSEERLRRRLDDPHRHAEVAPEVGGRQVVEEHAVRVTDCDGGNEHRAPEVGQRREMPPDVLAGEEARDADCAAEEVVRHGHDPDVVAVEPGPSEQRAEARAEHLPRDERDGSPHRGPRPPRDRPGEAGALEGRAVVPARAEHDLGVHADPRLREALEPREDLGGDARAPEQRVTQRRVGRVDGDVERREPLLDDALERRLVEIGERDVVAVEERQPEVVVLDVEAPPHPLRELVDEAEHALVRAGRDLARPGRLELDAEIGAAALERKRQRGALALDRERERLLARVEAEVDRVAEPWAVDREDAVAAGEAGPSGRGARSDAGDHHPGRVSARWRLHETLRAPRPALRNSSPARCTAGPR